jgi:hypothetical protein
MSEQKQIIQNRWQEMLSLTSRFQAKKSHLEECDVESLTQSIQSTLSLEAENNKIHALPALLVRSSKQDTSP